MGGSWTTSSSRSRARSLRPGCGRYCAGEHGYRMPSEEPFTSKVPVQVEDYPVSYTEHSADGDGWTGCTVSRRTASRWRCGAGDRHDGSAIKNPQVLWRPPGAPRDSTCPRSPAVARDRQDPLPAASGTGGLRLSDPPAAVRQVAVGLGAGELLRPLVGPRVRRHLRRYRHRTQPDRGAPPLRRTREPDRQTRCAMRGG